jgi:hypothetical protein
MWRIVGSKERARWLEDREGSALKKNNNST